MVRCLGRTVIGRTEMKDASSAVASVADSGPGIPSEKPSEVFDPFFTTRKQDMGKPIDRSTTCLILGETLGGVCACC